MKKLLFLFILIGAGLQLKAQANFEMRPFNKPDNIYKKYSFALPDSLTRLFPQNPNRVNPQRFDSFKPNLSKQYAYYQMPVVKTEGSSNMPVVKMQGNSKMPVINPDAGINSFIQKELP